MGEHANEIFLSIPTLKGLIIGGPGPTIFDFEKGDFLNYMLKEKILDTVDTLLLSEGLNIVRVTVKCNNCGYERKETMREQALPPFEQSLVGHPCPKCTAPSLAVAETKDIIDDLAELAEKVGANVEIISIETEEGQMLKNSFGESPPFSGSSFRVRKTWFACCYSSV